MLSNSLYRYAIITASDRGAYGEREDESGQMIRDIVGERGFQLEAYYLLPDEKNLLSETMRQLCDKGDAVDLILTTGGTGFSARDCMPEATMAIADRNVPGIAEAMRFHGMQFTRRAMLSRAVSVIRKQTLIINLPGSPKAVGENLLFIIDDLAHGIAILRGTTGNCARLS